MQFEDTTGPSRAHVTSGVTGSTGELRERREFDIIKTFSRGSRFGPLIIPEQTSNKIPYVSTDGFGESSPTHITSYTCTCGTKRVSPNVTNVRGAKEEKLNVPKVIKDLYINNE